MNTNDNKEPEKDFEMLITLGKFAALRLRPGDVLVLKVNRSLPAESIFRIKTRLSGFFPNNEIFILDNGVDIGILETRQGDAL